MNGDKFDNMSSLNFDDERISFTPAILFIDYINLQFNNYLKKNYSDITPRDFTYLANIFYHQKISQRELADLLYVSEANVAQIIKRLEKNGYVERVQEDNNRSRKNLYLTDKGKIILFKLLKDIYEKEVVFFEKFGGEDIAIEFKKLLYEYSEKSIDP